MSDTQMPDYANEPNEWESNQTVKFARHIEVQVKSYTNRIQLAHTLQALAAVKNDIERGALAANAQAKNVLKNLSNGRARELGFKPQGGVHWWN